MSEPAAAADRFFRSYHKHCLTPDEDTLFNVLNALHSFNDKLRKAGAGDLFGSTNFIGLKALRNLFHHESELLHEVRLIARANLPLIATELATVCLVERSLVERAVAGKTEKERTRVLNAFKWYGAVANIQPCVFNGAVDVFEVMQPLQAKPSSHEYAAFAASYRFEEEHGHPHRISGDLVCHAGSVDRILQTAFRARRGP